MRRSGVRLTAGTGVDENVARDVTALVVPPGDATGFVKIVADARYNELLGAHLIGPDVSELLPELTLAQQWDLTADEVGRNIHAHPSLSEALKEAVEGIAGHMINL